MLLLSNKRAGYLQNKGSLLSRSQPLCGPIHTSSVIIVRRSGAENERILSSVVLWVFLLTDSFKLLGGRMVEVLADKRARRARRQKGEGTRKEGRKDRGAF